jgi:tRNA U34 5-methylaminomethyl-2-thiouridine-forming methyltransferase MnmC
MTADGSHSVGIGQTDITYHSRHGAIRESKHVYMGHGLNHLLHKKPFINIFEMGLGTGLNALLALIEAEDHKQKIYYEAIEPFPLDNHLVNELNYIGQLQRPGAKPAFELIHRCPWQMEVLLNSFFHFKKVRDTMQHHVFDKTFDLMFYDAFAPAAEPQLWTDALFVKLYDALSCDGQLVTYCCKSSVQHTLKEAGFVIEKLPGPPHKRENLRATKKC